MPTSDTISVQVFNQLDFDLTVFSTVTPPVTNPPSTDPAAYIPTYTSIGSVPADGSATLDTGALLSRLVIARRADEFPVKLFVPDILGPATQPVTVQQSDLANTTASLKFYTDYMGQPCDPVAVRFNEIVTDVSNIDTLDSQVSVLLNSSGYPGADYFGFAMVSYWATNSLFAWPGTYSTYEPDPLSGVGFILPTVVAGTMVIANGLASFTATGGGAAYPSLAFAGGRITSPGATSTSGVIASSVYRTLTWEGNASQSGMFWVGTRDGAQFIMQPYENPPIPWWIAAYDLAFSAFYGVQIVMTIDVLTFVLRGLANGALWLEQNAPAIYDKIRTRLQNVSESADPDAGVGDPVEPVNIDVDVDVDVDADTDAVTDTDNVTDTAVDVDVDIDVDIDDDVFAVIDIDVDVDVDADTDVVTDTENVTDTDVDVDVDVDVDTRVDVPPGGVRRLASRVGDWILKKAFPEVVKNIAIMGMMNSVQSLFNVWSSTDEQDLANMAPQESTGVALLLNYMLNPNNPVTERWTTFADYVQQQQPDVTSQQMLLASIAMFGNAPADAEAAAWRWPQDVKNQLVQQMAQFSTPAEQYSAYLTLARFTFQGQPLPVKIGAGVATNYLTAIGGS